MDLLLIWNRLSFEVQFSLLTTTMQHEKFWFSYSCTYYYMTKNVSIYHEENKLCWLTINVFSNISKCFFFVFFPAYNIKKWFPSHQILFKDELHVWKKNTEILYTVVTFNSLITLYSWFLFWKLAKHLLLSVRQIHTIWTIGLNNMWNKRFQYIYVCLERWHFLRYLLRSP